MKREMQFGKKLKELRERSGLFQKDLAVELDILPSSISQYEKGKNLPEMPVLIKMADYFGVSLDELVYAVDNDADEVIDQHADFLVDLNAGLSAEELAEKYKMVVGDTEMPHEVVKRLLPQIEYEYNRYKKNTKS